MAPGKSLDTSSLDSTAGSTSSSCAGSRDGSYVLKLAKRHDIGRGASDHRRLAARSDVVSAEPDAMMQPLAIPTDSSWPQQWDMFDPASGIYGINLPGAGT